jgi:hypothetical protein
MLGISFVAAQLAASQEGLSSMSEGLSFIIQFEPFYISDYFKNCIVPYTYILSRRFLTKYLLLVEILQGMTQFRSVRQVYFNSFYVYYHSLLRTSSRCST